MKKIYYLLLLPLMAFSFAACSDDDFTESIFDTDIAVVDEDATTYPFDLWIYENFTVPYNVQIDYKFNFTASDMDFQLTPPEYKKSQMLAHFIRYLFYDIYTLYGGDDFMKEYGPRLFHFIGSSGYSASTGTEVLGTASAGVKITLYKINEMKTIYNGVEFDSDDILQLNEGYFHTMHHEFSHILHQTKSYPVTFGQITSGTYDPMDWQDRDSTETHQLGYVTHYASSAYYEDFVETLSCIITDTDYRWMLRIIDACLAGVLNGDKEQILELIDNLEVVGLDDPTKKWNDFTIYSEVEYDITEDDYVSTDRYVMDVRRDESSTTINKGSTAYVRQYKYTEEESFTSFTEFLEDWVPVISNTEDAEGMNAIMKKIDIANTWYDEKWGLDAFTIRAELRARQDSINDYIKNEVEIYDYQ